MHRCHHNHPHKSLHHHHPSPGPFWVEVIAISSTKSDQNITILIKIRHSITVLVDPIIIDFCCSWVDTALSSAQSPCDSSYPSPSPSPAADLHQQNHHSHCQYRPGWHLKHLDLSPWTYRHSPRHTCKSVAINITRLNGWVRIITVTITGGVTIPICIQSFDGGICVLYFQNTSMETTISIIVCLSNGRIVVITIIVTCREAISIIVKQVCN